MKKIGKEDIKKAMNKIMPPKTKKAIVDFLKMDNWRQEQGCDRSSCPFIEFMVKKAEEVEIKEKKLEEEE